jgi:hypothetical protein
VVSATTAGMSASAAGMSAAGEAGRVLWSWRMRSGANMALAVAGLIGLEVIERNCAA